MNEKGKSTMRARTHGNTGRIELDILSICELSHKVDSTASVQQNSRDSCFSFVVA